ncbi:hypothetical protein POTOM_059179 [Populus tomentosa]|uniref:Uncharacterized protein n=1 Tax=Populus tomentosa TaxID=118781 RepID=A0A8X7XSC9_POPTO|nr:hypothetical protein POTOM_059179 [Populus tomentosa]
MREDWMRTTPPSLLSLTIDTAVLHLSNFSDLSSIPDHIILDLFLVLLFSSLHLFIYLQKSFVLADFLAFPFHLMRTLKAGKLTEKVLKLFVATRNDEVLAFIQALNIQHVITPVLPTSELHLKFFHPILPDVLSWILKLFSYILIVY